MTKTGGSDQTKAVGEEERGAISLADVFERHAAYVWSSLRRLGVPEADAEDLLADVFLQVHRQLATYDAARPIRPWLFGFAFRIASQHRRSARQKHERLVEVDVEDPAPGPHDEAVRAEDRALLLEAMEGVELDRRAVLVLFEIDEVPMKEVAASLDIPVNTAWSRLRLAREELAAAVKRIKARRRSR